jgi:DNA-binding SARP family transcriptional activator
MRIALLGPLEVSGADGQVRIAGVKQQALVSLLALNAGRLICVDQLIVGLWGEGGPRNAVNALHHQVARLRETIGSGLVLWHSSGYVLDVPPDSIDVRRFVRLAADGRRALRGDDATAAAALLQSALGLWRGLPLDGLSECAWAVAEVNQLEQLRLDVIEDRLDAELALGLHADRVGELQTLVSDYPFRGRLWGQLMLALYRSGRQADALDAYQAARQLLSDEHGLDPGPHLRELQAAILGHDPALALTGARDHGRDEPPVRASAPRRTGNLPVPLTSFIGRDEQLQQTHGLVRECRLLTQNRLARRRQDATGTRGRAGSAA